MKNVEIRTKFLHHYIYFRIHNIVTELSRPEIDYIRIRYSEFTTNTDVFLRQNSIIKSLVSLFVAIFVEVGSF